MIECELNKQTKEIEVLLSFKRDELLYDISNAAYIEGHILEQGQQHLKHVLQDVAEAGNIDRVTRVINLSVERCKELLYPFTNNDIYASVLDDELEAPTVYGIIMKVPDDFSQTTLFLLEKLVHEYIVSKSLADWMSIVNPAKMQVWELKAVELEQEIRVSLHSRRAKIRRRLHPF